MVGTVGTPLYWVHARTQWTTTRKCYECIRGLDMSTPAYVLANARMYVSREGGELETFNRGSLCSVGEEGGCFNLSSRLPWRPAPSV